MVLIASGIHQLILELLAVRHFRKLGRTLKTI